MYKKVMSCVLASMLGAGAASAAVLPTTVTATGTYNGDLAVLNDGIFPANGSLYDSADKVSFRAPSAEFRFSFGGLVSIESLSATVDNNDNYSFAFYDGATQVGQLTIGAGEGSVGFGVETFNRIFGPISANSVVVTALAGDSAYSIGEVQFSGTALNAVPEPATWALMLSGFGLVGAASRRRIQATAVTA